MLTAIKNQTADLIWFGTSVPKQTSIFLNIFFDLKNLPKLTNLRSSTERMIAMVTEIINVCYQSFLAHSTQRSAVAWIRTPNLFLPFIKKNDSIYWKKWNSITTSIRHFYKIWAVWKPDTFWCPKSRLVGHLKFWVNYNFAQV